MEIVKNNKAEDKALIDLQLENWLYRKEEQENYMVVLHEGIGAYENYITELKEGKSSQDKVNLFETEKKLREIIVEMQYSTNAYQHICKKIKELTGDEDGKMEAAINGMREFRKSLSSESKEFSDCEVKPEDIEHIHVIKQYTNALSKYGKLFNELQLKATKTASEEVEIYELKLKLQNMEMILEERTQYYQKTFLPRYNKDMREYRKYFKKYLKYATDINSFGNPIDFTLLAIVQNYKENKDDKQWTWTLWTKLRGQVNFVQQSLSKLENLPEHLVKFSKPLMN